MYLSVGILTLTLSSSPLGEAAEAACCKWARLFMVYTLRVSKCSGAGFFKPLRIVPAWGQYVKVTCCWEHTH